MESRRSPGGLAPSPVSCPGDRPGMARQELGGRKKNSKKKSTEQLIHEELEYLRGILADARLGLPTQTKPTPSQTKKYTSTLPPDSKPNNDSAPPSSTAPSQDSGKIPKSARGYFTYTQQNRLSWGFRRLNEDLQKDYKDLVHTYVYKAKHLPNKDPHKRDYRILGFLHYVDPEYFRLVYLMYLRETVDNFISCCGRHLAVLGINSTLILALWARIDEEIRSLELCKRHNIKDYGNAYNSPHLQAMCDLEHGAYANTPETINFILKWGFLPTPLEFERPLTPYHIWFDNGRFDIEPLTLALHVYKLKTGGRTDKEIAKQLGITVDQVGKYFNRAYRLVYSERDVPTQEAKEKRKEIKVLPCDHCEKRAGCGIYSGKVLYTNKPTHCRRTNFKCYSTWNRESKTGRRCRLPYIGRVDDHKEILRERRKLIRVSTCEIINASLKAAELPQEPTRVKDTTWYKKTWAARGSGRGTRKAFWKGKKDTENEDKRFVKWTEVFHKRRDPLGAVSRFYGYSDVLPWWINNGHQPDEYRTKPDWPHEEYREQYKEFLKSQEEHLKGYYREDLKGRDEDLHRFFFGTPEFSDKKAALKFLEIDGVDVKTAEQEVYLWWRRIWDDRKLPEGEREPNHDIAWQTLRAYLILTEPEKTPPKPGLQEFCEICMSFVPETLVRLKPTIQLVCKNCLHIDDNWKKRRSEWDSLSPEERTRIKAALYHTLPSGVKPPRGYEKYLPHTKAPYPQYWANVPKFLVGDKIGHPAFSAGVIRAVRGDGINTLITVAFKDSTETLPALSSCLFQAKTRQNLALRKESPKWRERLSGLTSPHRINAGLCCVEYKGFTGSVHYAEDKLFYGKVEGINDLVAFEGNTIEEFRERFRGAVEDYISIKDLPTPTDTGEEAEEAGTKEVSLV